MFSIVRRNKKKREDALKSKPVTSGYIPPRTTRETESYADNYLSNPLHPLNPLNPIYAASDPAPVRAEESCPSPSYSSDDSYRSSYDSGSSYSSYDSSSSSSYDSGSSSSSCSSD